MTNNKQSIKLYTEEQIKEMLDFFQVRDEDIVQFIDKMKPIELPSNEEIEEMGKDVIVYNDTKRGWFIEGLKFMRNKIQGGNK